MNELAQIEPLKIPAEPLRTFAHAEQTLKMLALAEAGEALWTRAKDARMIFEAVLAKLICQAEYAVWRATVARHGYGPGRGHKGISEQQSLLPAGDPGDMVVHRWRKRLCQKVGPNLWCKDEAAIQLIMNDVYRRAVRLCEQENIGTIRGTEGTGEFERYTPAYYVALAREVLGTIDLDPASSVYAQQTVRATNYFTTEDDGLAQEWHGRVWLNPPYHRELAPLFIDKLIAEVRAGHTSAAVLLTNNATDTAWARAAADACNAICFTTGRIRFEVPNAEPVLPTQGQAFFYFGAETDIFVDVFKAIGWCVRPA